MNRTNELHLNGIIVPLVTPLLEQDVLDVEGLKRLIDHVIDGQVNGIFILGSTGEAPSLSFSMRKKIIEESCAYIKHRVPVFVGIMDTSIAQAAETSDIAARNGADVVVTGAPFYFPISQDSLFEYTKALTEKVSLPVCIYNKPDCMKNVFEIETLRKLLAVKNIIGVKDSSGDRAYFKKLLRLKQDRPDWLVYMGIEELLADAVADGADGGVTGGANLLPNLYTDLYRAAVDKDKSKIQTLHNRVMDLSGHLYRPDYLAGLKYAMSCKKLCLETLSLPLGAANPKQKKQIEQYLLGLSYP